MKNYKVRVKKTGAIGILVSDDELVLKDTCNYCVSFSEQHEWYGKQWKPRYYYGRDIEIINTNLDQPTQ